MRLLAALLLGAAPWLAAAGAGAGGPDTAGAATTMTPSSDSVRALEQRFGPSPGGQVVVVDVANQRLYLFRGGDLVAQWPVSTSRYGIGNREESHKTPTGAHRVARKIGDGAPVGTLFRGRRDTGRIVTIHRDDTPAPEDYVTTRILWLEGLEPGINKGAGIDSFQRYIYIHGTAEEGRIGTPASHGCVRMRNADVIELFDLIDMGTLVDIRAP